MINNGRRRGKIGVYRLGLVSLFALWWTASQHSVLVEAYTCGNSICESAAGENHDNCSVDCDLICGNNMCEAGESCQGCPEDCEESCVCGDSNCNWPAESGGWPWDTCEDAALYFPNTTCTYCAQDCGECDNELCANLNSGTCDGNGQCGRCDEFRDTCASGYFCNGAGECQPVPGP